MNFDILTQQLRRRIQDFSWIATAYLSAVVALSITASVEMIARLGLAG